MIFGSGKKWRSGKAVWPSCILRGGSSRQLQGWIPTEVARRPTKGRTEGDSALNLLQTVFKRMSVAREEAGFAAEWLGLISVLFGRCPCYAGGTLNPGPMLVPQLLAAHQLGWLPLGLPGVQELLRQTTAGIWLASPVNRWRVSCAPISKTFYNPSRLEQL